MGGKSINPLCKKHEDPGIFFINSNALIFLVNPVGATLAGIPLTTISKSYDWGGVFVVLELASLFCGCLLIGARNVSRRMIDPSKFEWRFYTNKETWPEQPNVMFKSFTPGVKTSQNFGKVFHIFKLPQNVIIILQHVTHFNWNNFIQKTNKYISFFVSRFEHNYYLTVCAGWLNDVNALQISFFWSHIIVVGKLILTSDFENLRNP